MPYTSCTTPVVPLARAFAVHGLTYILRIIRWAGPHQAGTRFGRLKTSVCEDRRQSPFCVASGGSPIWLSDHPFQRVREDGKFKNLVMVGLLFGFP